MQTCQMKWGYIPNPFASQDAEKAGFKKPASTRYERLNSHDRLLVDAAIYNASCERDIVRIIDSIREGRVIKGVSKGVAWEYQGYSKLVDIAIEEFRSITGAGRLH